MSSVVRSLSPTPNNSDTFTVLSAMTSSSPTSTTKISSIIPLSSSQLSSASMTGLVSPNTPIVPISSSSFTPQTVNGDTNIPLSLQQTSQLSISSIGEKLNNRITGGTPDAIITTNTTPTDSLITSNQLPKISQSIYPSSITRVNTPVPSRDNNMLFNNNSLPQIPPSTFNRSISTFTPINNISSNQQTINNTNMKVSSLTGIPSSAFTPIPLINSPTIPSNNINISTVPQSLPISKTIVAPISQQPIVLSTIPQQSIVLSTIPQQQLVSNIPLKAPTPIVSSVSQPLISTTTVTPPLIATSTVSLNSLSNGQLNQQLSVSDQSINQQSLVPNSSVIPINQSYTKPSTSPRISTNTQMITIPTTPTARSALLNLTAQKQDQKSESILFPTVKEVKQDTDIIIKPTAEIKNGEFEVRDYRGLVANSSIENELLNSGYGPLSRIVIRTDNGEKRTQYIKAINKKGQKVFIAIDVHGYTSARSTDLTLIEAHNASIVPYSLKTGAYECAGKDVCGVAFECGADAVCVLSRGTDDLTPKEANFVFVEQNAPEAASLEINGTILTYPVIKLSEIRANPDEVLKNTDIATRRLRNSSYTITFYELKHEKESINKLSEAFAKFDAIRENAAIKLNKTLRTLEEWNDVYMQNPPTSDDNKDRYRKLQFNLAQRNDNISTLLRAMKKVADMNIEIDNITRNIDAITDHCEQEFANIEYANSE